jgi:hypothetical protein
VREQLVTLHASLQFCQQGHPLAYVVPAKIALCPVCELVYIRVGKWLFWEPDPHFRRLVKTLLNTQSDLQLALSALAAHERGQPDLGRRLADLVRAPEQLMDPGWLLGLPEAPSEDPQF